MKKLLGILLLAVTGLVSASAETIDLTSGWLVQPVSTKNQNDKSVCIPASDDPAAWKEGGELKRKPPQAKGERGGNNAQAAYNCWYRRDLDVPAAWKGRSVTLELQLNYCDVVVFVNGKQADVMFHPDGVAELAPHLTYGKPNRLELFVTNQCRGTGEKEFAYVGRDDYAKGKDLFQSPALLQVRSSAYLADVFAMPSTRKQRLTLRCEVPSLKKQDVELLCTIYKDEGRDPESKALVCKQVVKKFKKTFSLEAGTNTVDFAMKWEDAETWELDRPTLYVCHAAIQCADQTRSAYEPFLFGFRELWRLGKDIYMNGHVQRYRGFWRQKLPKNGIAEVKKYGYNLIYQTHMHESRWEEDAKFFEECARAGVAIFAGSPTVQLRYNQICTNPEAEKQYRRHVRHWMRSHRNLPVVAGTSVGVNMMCAAWWSMGAQDFGGHEPKPGDDNSGRIGRCCDICREYNPNAMYFAHGDGHIGDVCNSNFYFNFVPLQEREEWLSHWSKNGKISCYPAEFGAPYYACWFAASGGWGAPRLPAMTEWCAIYFGEKAYELETDGMLEKMREFQKDCQRKTHGGWVDGKDLYAFSPLGRELNRLFVSRVNRAWRAWGQGPGIMYLVSWDWDTPNEVLDTQKLYNGNLITFFGGDVSTTNTEETVGFADKKHAFWEGEPIRKSLVFVWDGFGEHSVKASWTFKDATTGEVLAKGDKSVALAQGEIRFEPIEVAAPTGKGARSAYRFDVTFDAEGIDDACRHDSFDVEVYGKALLTAPWGGPALPIFDPRGESTEMLKTLGIPTTPCASLQELLASKGSRIIIGRRALDGLDATDGLGALSDFVANGGQALILPQSADIWQKMGLRTEDQMPRMMHNVDLEGVDSTDLSYWDGFPMQLRDGKEWEYGNNWGFVQKKHRGGRGWRWTHTHALASETFEIPQRAGFRPLVRGDFDMSYSPLLRFSAGKGSALLCALDFEGRVGESGCPAATRVAKATMNAFLTPAPEATCTVYTHGKTAERLAESLGLDAKPYATSKALAGGILLVGGADATLTLADLKKAVKGGGHALVLENDAIAKEAGLTPVRSEKAVFRVSPKAFRAFQGFPFSGVGPSLLRWHDELHPSILHAAQGWKVAGDGLFAISDDGAILFDQIPLYETTDRYREAKDWGGHANFARSQENMMRRIALVLGNWGAQSGKAMLDRLCYLPVEQVYEPLAGDLHVLGPWPVEKEDSKVMVDTVFDADAEAQAKSGKLDFNRPFRPAGLVYAPASDADFISWKTVAHSETNGYVDLKQIPLVKQNKFGTTYVVATVERKTDAPAWMKFGLEWRGRIWLNGEEVLTTYDGKSKADSHHVRLPFHKGTNTLTFKIGNGKNGNFFWANITNEDKIFTPEVQAFIDRAAPGKLYWSENDKFDPYLFVYW